MVRQVDDALLITDSLAVAMAYVQRMTQGTPDAFIEDAAFCCMFRFPAAVLKLIPPMIDLSMIDSSVIAHHVPHKSPMKSRVS